MKSEIGKSPHKQLIIDGTRKAIDHKFTEECLPLSINGNEGGVRVTFATPFKALPSVILTPVVDTPLNSVNHVLDRACTASSRV